MEERRHTGRYRPRQRHLSWRREFISRVTDGRRQQENGERTQRKKAEEAEAAARQKNEEELKRLYFDYLRGREAQRQKDQPNAHRGFLKDTAAKRVAVENDPAHKGAAKNIYLRLFDDEESRLERFRDFFQEPSFNEWQQLNTDGSRL